MNTPSDAQWLADYARTGPEAPFAALIERHVDLVHSAAFRLTRDPHLAEDVSQEVFTVLAREALRVSGRVDSGLPLSAWLHTTTRNVAAKLVRTTIRRREREKVSVSMTPQCQRRRHRWPPIPKAKEEGE